LEDEPISEDDDEDE